MVHGERSVCMGAGLGGERGGLVYSTDNYVLHRAGSAGLGCVYIYIYVCMEFVLFIEPMSA